MDKLLDGLGEFGHAALGLLGHPFYYIGILFVILHYRRQIALERKLFSVRLHSLWSETWRIVLWGLLGGMLASVMMMFIGATLQFEAVVLIWVLSLLMVLIKLRFLCFAYAVGFIGILHVAAGWFPQLKGEHAASWLTEPLLELHIPALLALVGVLHLVEAAFVRWQGGRMATPLFFAGKRGKLVGGYQLQGFWPVPLFLIVPTGTAGGGAEALPWQPLIGGTDLWTGGWTMLAFPVVIGFSELAISHVPQMKLRLSSRMLTAYGLAVLALAIGAEFWAPLTLAAALLTVALHEAIILFNRWDEQQEAPVFAHSDKGLNILAVLPGSSAEKLGIQIGETLNKVNGIKVRTKEELHAAMRASSAFCKLEVLDSQGQVRFLQCAIFSGEHHQLGLILSPDHHAKYYVELKEQGLLSYFFNKLSGLAPNRSQINIEL